MIAIRKYISIEAKVNGITGYIIENTLAHNLGNTPYILYLRIYLKVQK